MYNSHRQRSLALSSLIPEKNVLGSHSFFVSCSTGSVQLFCHNWLQLVWKKAARSGLEKWDFTKQSVWRPKEYNYKLLKGKGKPVQIYILSDQIFFQDCMGMYRLSITHPVSLMCMLCYEENSPFDFFYVLLYRVWPHRTLHMLPPPATWAGVNTATISALQRLLQHCQPFRVTWRHLD